MRCDQSHHIHPAHSLSIIAGQEELEQPVSAMMAQCAPAREHRFEAVFDPRCSHLRTLPRHPGKCLITSSCPLGTLLVAVARNCVKRTPLCSLSMCGGASVVCVRNSWSAPRSRTCACQPET